MSQADAIYGQVGWWLTRLFNLFGYHCNLIFHRVRTEHGSLHVYVSNRNCCETLRWTKLLLLLGGVGQRGVLHTYLLFRYFFAPKVLSVPVSSEWQLFVQNIHTRRWRVTFGAPSPAGQLWLLVSWSWAGRVYVKKYAALDFGFFLHPINFFRWNLSWWEGQKCAAASKY